MMVEEIVDKIGNLRDDDQINDFEEAFMRGYESEFED